jgi:hypothetical protein
MSETINADHPKMVPEFEVADYTTPVPAVMNTWYTMFDEYDVEVYGAGVRVTVANETLELRVTIDGVVLNNDGGVACAFAGNNSTCLPMILYSAALGTRLFSQTAAGTIILTTAVGIVAWCKGRHVVIECRKITAGGASFLQGTTFYGKHI